MSVEKAIIVGAGLGLSASLARLLSKSGFDLVLASRNVEKNYNLAKETNAKLEECDVTSIQQVENLFKRADDILGTPDLVIFNPSARLRGTVEELDMRAAKKAIEVSTIGALSVAKEAATRMLIRGSGSIFFTGASASVKGFANSSVFAVGKFGLRGLAQSLARELHPKNIHIGHFVVDGQISPPLDTNNELDSKLISDEIANAYLHMHRQHRSVWSWEIELRPWVERF